MPIDALTFVILALASYRATRFFVKDSLFGFGADSASRLSVKIDRFGYDDEGADRSWLRGKIADLLTCTFCLGAWISLAIVCAYLRATPIELGVDGWAIAWAVAGAQGFLNSRMNA
jgi:hypothetical protein